MECITTGNDTLHATICNSCEPQCPTAVFVCICMRASLQADKVHLSQSVNGALTCAVSQGIGCGTAELWSSTVKRRQLRSNRPTRLGAAMGKHPLPRPPVTPLGTPHMDTMPIGLTISTARTHTLRLRPSWGLSLSTSMMTVMERVTALTCKTQQRVWGMRWQTP